jgi:hypothetical protein
MEAKSLKGLIVLGIVLALCAVARADEPEARILPEGTVIQLPRGGETLTLTDRRFLVSRADVDHSNVTDVIARRLTADLLGCSEALEAKRRPEPGWQVGLRWTLIGVAVGGAFVAGGWLL